MDITCPEDLEIVGSLNIVFDIYHFFLWIYLVNLLLTFPFQLMSKLLNLCFLPVKAFGR